MEGCIKGQRLTVVSHRLVGQLLPFQRLCQGEVVGGPHRFQPDGVTEVGRGLGVVSPSGRRLSQVIMRLDIRWLGLQSGAEMGGALLEVALLDEDSALLTSK